MATDEQISIMCDIARSGRADLTPQKAAALPPMVAEGLIEPTSDLEGSVEKYQITPKGQRLLDDRGVGVNES